MYVGCAMVARMAVIGLAAGCESDDDQALHYYCAFIAIPGIHQQYRMIGYGAYKEYIDNMDPS